MTIDEGGEGLASKSSAFQYSFPIKEDLLLTQFD